MAWTAAGACGGAPPADAWAAVQAAAVSRPAGTANVAPAAIMPMPTRNRTPRATLPTSPSPCVRRMPAACVALQPCPPSDRRADRQQRPVASTRASSPGWAARPAGLAHDTPQGESLQPSHTGRMRSHGVHGARGCPCPSPDTPCGHPAPRSSSEHRLSTCVSSWFALGWHAIPEGGAAGSEARAEDGDMCGRWAPLFRWSGELAHAAGFEHASGRLRCRHAARDSPATRIRPSWRRHRPAPAAPRRRTRAAARARSATRCRSCCRSPR